MKPTISEKLIAYLTLLSGLSISAVAIYYSVAGLAAIFAAAVIPIIVMGIILEVSKLVATVWLKQNWTIAPISIRIYLLISIAVLMVITSMGIFGFLSKAHSDQTIISGDAQSRLSLYDEKIKVQRDNIELARKALAQMDAQVDARLSRGDSETGAERAVTIRRQQAPERAKLQKEISEAQREINKLNEERSPIAAETRKIEAEVGPIKYIAAFIYGETDKNLLEKAVTWVIIIIVFVFDPLAVVLLLASQVSFQNFRERVNNGNSPKKESDIVSTATVTESNDDALRQQRIDAVENSTPWPTEWAESETHEVPTENTTDDFDISKHPYLFKIPNSYHPPGIEPIGPQVFKPESAEPVQEVKIEELVKKIEENVEKLEEYYQNNNPEEDKLDKLFDWSQVPPGSEYVNVNGEKMSVKVALEKFPINPIQKKNDI